MLEVDLVATVADVSIRPSGPTRAWTYGGRIPGPLLKLTRGDRLIVHFTNQLPEETTIHWHGLRIPAAMDGVPVHSQPGVKPGETFTYDFMVPDAGLFWYHPHVNSAAQEGFGLYGALLVEDTPEVEAGDPLVLVLSDLALDDNGQLASPASGGDLGTLFGREGDDVLVNGRKDPVLRARAGRRQRWRVVNAAKSRYFWVAIAGHRFTRIGGDGGLLTRPVEEDRILLAPGERADVSFVPMGAPGSELDVQWVAYDHGYGSAFNRPPVRMMRIALEPGAQETPVALPVGLGRSIPALADEPAAAGAKTIDLRLTQNNQGTKFAMGINGVPFGDDKPLLATIGETQIWNVSTDLDFAHPFHLHGFFFQVLETNGEPNAVREWKDTANVPQKGSMKLIVRFDERPGMWMFHCHILDHADAGMMGMVHLSP